MFKPFWFLNILLSVFSKVASRDAIKETLMPPKLLQVQKLIDMFLSNSLFLCSDSQLCSILCQI